jgi:hypothetical protein
MTPPEEQEHRGVPGKTSALVPAEGFSPLEQGSGHLPDHREGERPLGQNPVRRLRQPAQTHTSRDAETGSAGEGSMRTNHASLIPSRSAPMGEQIL